MQAKIDSMSGQSSPDALSKSVSIPGDENRTVNQQRELVLKLDFFYLQKNGGMKFETTSIKEKWLNIYNHYISDSSPLQINVDYQKFEILGELRQKIESDIDNIEANEYILSFEDTMMEVWFLMENLYLHFQISDKYKDIFKSQFPKYVKYNQKNNIHKDLVDNKSNSIEIIASKSLSDDDKPVSPSSTTATATTAQDNLSTIQLVLE